MIDDCDMAGHGPCVGRMLTFPNHYNRCAGHYNLHNAWSLAISDARINGELDSMQDFAPWLDGLDSGYYMQIAERSLSADMWPLKRVDP